MIIFFFWFQLVTLQIIVLVIAAGGANGERATGRSLPRYVFKEQDYQNDLMLAKMYNFTTIYDMLYRMTMYNFTTEDKLNLLERKIKSGRVCVDWVFRRIIKNFIPYINNVTAQGRVHLLKMMRVFPSFAALPKSSGRFRAWHGRFTNLSRIVQHTNATYNAIGNQVVLIAHARAYNATFVYRNHELEVGDRRLEGSVSGGFDYIEFRLINSWVTMPKCKLLYAFHSVHRTKGCYVNVKRLGEYEYLNVELGVNVCQHLEDNVKRILDDIFALYWRLATDDTDLCRSVIFKEIFNVASYIPMQ